MNRIKTIVLKGAIIQLTTNQLRHIGSYPEIYHHNLRTSYEITIPILTFHKYLWEQPSPNILTPFSG